MDNLITPLTQGLTQAMQIHAFVQHQRDQNEALQRQKFLDARNQRIQDMTIQNAQEDRQRRNNSEDIAQTQALTQSGATPLQDGLLKSTIAPPAAQTPFSVPVNGPEGQLPPASAFMSAPGTGPVGPGAPGPAPPAASMQFSDPLSAIRSSVQPTTVAAAPDPARVVKANSGVQYQLPSQADTQQNALQKARADAQIKADAKKQEEQVEDPDNPGKFLDSRAIALVNNRSTIKGENTRSTADRTSREKIAADTDKRDRDLAADREKGENTRAGARNATELAAADRRAQPKPLNPLEKAKYDTTLAANMTRAERDFAVGRMKALQKAKAGNSDATEKDIDGTTMNELITARDRAKQDAHDAYREKLGGFGVNVDPIDFGAQTRARMAAQSQAASPAAANAPAAKQQSAAPATSVPAAPAKPSQYKVGQVVTKGGKQFKVTGFNPDGTLQAQPL